MIRKNNPLLILFSLLLLRLSPAAAGIKPEIPKTAIRLAEPFEAVYRVPMEDDESLDLSGWKSGITQWGSLTLWDFKMERKDKAAELHVTLMPFVLGKAEIPNLKIPVIKNFQKAQEMAGGGSNIIDTEPAGIVVADPTAQSQGPAAPKDIKSPRKPLYFWEHPLGMALIFLSALLVSLGLALLWWSNRKKKTESAINQEEALSAEDAFYRRLSELEQSGLLEAGRVREFYFALSSAFRNYLDKRYSLDTEPLTSAELIRLLNARRAEMELEPGETLKLRECLELMDLAKFAKYRPERQEQNQTIQTLQDFVETHRKKIQPEKTEIKR